MKIIHVEDFEETQLPDDEIEELDKRKQKQAASEKEKEALRRAKLYSFKFKGGMP
jgi:hypothetical protein